MGRPGNTAPVVEEFRPDQRCAHPLKREGSSKAKSQPVAARARRSFEAKRGHRGAVIIVPSARRM
jgi:hypothetical protein